MKKQFFVIALLIIGSFIIGFMSSVSYATVIHDDGILIVDNDGYIYGKTDGAIELGKSGNEWEDIYTDSITLGGVAKTSWGSVVTPWVDNGTYIAPTGAPTAVKIYLNGNGIFIGDIDADSYIMENDAQLDNAVNNTVTLTENDDIFSIVFATTDITLSASDGSIELYPEADATEGTVDFLTGGDTNDFLYVKTTSNVPILATSGGCNLSIVPDGGTLALTGILTVSGAQTLTGATTLTSVIIGDDTYDVVVDDEHRFTSNDSDVVVDVFATTDKDAILQLTADLSADSGDEWQLKNDDADSNALLFINDTGGSLATIMELSVGGVLTLTSNLVGENADVLDNATDDTFQFSSNDLDTTIRAYGYEEKDAILRLTADESDNDGDEWQIKHEATGNHLQFVTDASGSDVVLAYFNASTGFHLGGALGVCGVTTLSGNVNMYQADLTITDATLGDSLTFDTSAGDLAIAGDLSVDGDDINADGNLTIDAEGGTLALQAGSTDILTVGGLGVCVIGNISNTGDVYVGGDITAASMKSGTDQGDAGAAAGELYYDTNDDDTIKMGT